MKERLAYKSVPWSTDSNFTPSAVASGRRSPGRFNFDALEKQHGLEGLVVPVIGFSYNARGQTIADTLLLQFVNPLDPLDARTLFFDDTGLVEDFTENDLGNGWWVPYLKGDSGNRYELHFTTTGDVGEKRALLEIWYLPVHSLGSYACRFLGDRE